MAIHPKSGHPEWYVESLAERYQYLSDELTRQKAKHLLDVETIGIATAAALLAFLVFKSVWAACLPVLFLVSMRRLELRHRRYLLATQMLIIESEFPYVRENIALPDGERP